jgi:hypothetical protein
MSYLDTLTRAAKSPITDFHLCLLHHPSQQDKIYSFFSQKSVIDVWSKIQSLDVNLSKIERSYAIKLAIAYQEKADLDENFENWVEAYELWRHYQKNYTKAFNEFKRSNIVANKDNPSHKLKPEHVLDKPASSKPNGVDFLLSIAGMFDSGESNETSDNVKPLVADLIAQKYGK